jgi:hypothetical protein
MSRKSCLILTETGRDQGPWLQLFVVCGRACMMILGDGKVFHSAGSERARIHPESHANSDAVTRRMGFLLRELASAFESHTVF